MTTSRTGRARENERGSGTPDITSRRRFDVEQRREPVGPAHPFYGMGFYVFHTHGDRAVTRQLLDQVANELE